MSKSFLKNLIFNNTSQGLQFGSRWVFNLVLIALLNNTDFGIFAYGLAFSNILMAILPFGSPVYLIGTVTNKNKYGELADSLVLIIIIFLISFFLFFLIKYLPFSIKNFNVLFYGLLLGFILSINTVLYYFLKSTGNFLEEIKVSILFFLLILTFIFYYYVFKNPLPKINTIFNLLILFNVVVTLYLFIFSKKINTKLIIKNVTNAIQNIKSVIKKRFYFGLQELMTASYTQLGMFVLFYFLSTENYGLYRKLFVLIAPIYLLSVSLAQVLLHHLKKSNTKILKIEFRKYQKYTLLGSLLIVGFVFLFREQLITLLGKIKFTQEINNAFILVLFISFIRFIYGNYEMFLVRIDKQKLRFWVVFFAAIIHIISIFILVPKFDLIGAVLTNVISNFIVLLGLLFISEKKLFINENNNINIKISK